MYVSPALFAEQMAGLARAGYCTTTLDAPRPELGNPHRKFVLTFDDGYANVLTHAAPVLRAHGFTAIQFLVSGEIGGSNSWDQREGGEVREPLMNDEQVRAWLALGHEIGSHSVSHPRLTRLSRDAQRDELRASKQQLEDRFGVAVRHFCYPYGDFDAALANLVREAGYDTACSQIGGVNHASTDRFSIRRLEGRYPKRSPRAVLQRLWRRVRRWTGAES